MDALAHEIRDFLVAKVARTGGHQFAAGAAKATAPNASFRTFSDM